MYLLSGKIFIYHDLKSGIDALIVKYSSHCLWRFVICSQLYATKLLTRTGKASRGIMWGKGRLLSCITARARKVNWYKPILVSVSGTRDTGQSSENCNQPRLRSICGDHKCCSTFTTAVCRTESVSLIFHRHHHQHQVIRFRWFGCVCQTTVVKFSSIVKITAKMQSYLYLCLLLCVYLCTALQHHPYCNKSEECCCSYKSCHGDPCSNVAQLKIVSGTALFEYIKWYKDFPSRSISYTNYIAALLLFKILAGM